MEEQVKEGFRDHLYNTDQKGHRVGFYPKRPHGRFYNRRILVSLILLVIFFGLPWIKSGGHPFFMLNVLERKFFIFGAKFWPQDFLLFALLAVTFVVFIFLFTSVFGRIWCGWTCPQTVFLEMVYRRIEFWIEGDAAAQRRLAKSGWTWTKVWKRTLKHSVFLTIAAWVSHTVLAFIIGMDNVLKYITSSPMEHPVTFAVILLNTGVFYFVFSWFREQACIYMCPYGRLQGVLLDKDTLVISYDSVRGEPRGKLKKIGTEESNGKELGDCIDCRMCVAVCPTGIDIRHGTQLECVNCTACIDACDEIMDKVGRPRGLVRYASLRQVLTKTSFKLTWRAYLYTAIVGVFLTAFIVVLLNSGDLKVTLLRAPGQTFTETLEGNYTNLYEVNLVNKSSEKRDFTFALHDTNGKVTILGQKQVVVEGGASANAKVLVELPPEEIEGMSFKLDIDIMESGEPVQTVTTKFSGPML